MRKNIVPAIVILLISGCSDSSAVQDADVALMADLRCTARQIKDKRFRIANELRFREDSLMQQNSTLPAEEKQQSDSIRQVLTTETGKVAERLTFVMDSLFENRYKTAALREAFDRAVEKKLVEVCP